MKKKRKRTNMRKEAAVRSFLIRSFGDVPVRDAKKDLRVYAGSEDVEGAVRGDPECCVFANACKRLFHSRQVIFLRGFAYVELMQDNGTWVVERFKVTNKMKSLIAQFDETGQASPGGYLLRAPSESQTLEGKREIDRRRRESMSPEEISRENEKRKKRKIFGGTAYEHLSPAQKTWQIIGQRYGKGLIHFRKIKEQQESKRDE